MFQYFRQQYLILFTLEEIGLKKRKGKIHKIIFKMIFRYVIFLYSGNTLSPKLINTE